MYSIGLQVLRAKLRGFHLTGSAITSRISRSEKQHKHNLWKFKREIGLYCRYHLVAYGLLRGVPYNQIERCAPQNKLNPKNILEIMLTHADWQQKKGLDLAKVESLLSMTSPTNVPSHPTLKKSIIAKSSEAISEAARKKV